MLILMSFYHLLFMEPLFAHIKEGKSALLTEEVVSIPIYEVFPDPSVLCSIVVVIRPL